MLTDREAFVICMLVNWKVSNGHSRLRKDDEKMTKNTVNLGSAAAHAQNDLPQSTVKYNYCQLLSKYKNQENALTGGESKRERHM